MVNGLIIERTNPSNRQAHRDILIALTRWVSNRRCLFVSASPLTSFHRLISSANERPPHDLCVPPCVTVSARSCSVRANSTRQRWCWGGVLPWPSATDRRSRSPLRPPSAWRGSRNCWSRSERPPRARPTTALPPRALYMH